MKKIIALVALLAIGAITYFGYQSYQAAEIVKAATPSIKEASLRAKQISESVINPSNETFAEIFKNANSAVDKTGEFILSLESQDSQANPEAITAGVKYLKDLQMLTRALHTDVRLKLDERRLDERSSAALEDLKSSNEYIRKNARERLEKVIKEMQQHVEKMESNAVEASTAIEKLEASRIEAAKYFPNDALLSQESIATLQQYYVLETEEDKK